MHLSAPLQSEIDLIAANNNALFDWLNARKLKAGAIRPDLHRGTGGVRALGRLAFLNNQQKLKEKLTDLLVQLKKQPSDGDIEVILCGSAGGGTASGGMLDLSWLVRNCANSLSCSGTSILLALSEPISAEVAESSTVEKKQRLENAFALFTEMERFHLAKGMEFSPVEGEIAESHWFDRCLFTMGTPRINKTQKQIQTSAANAISAWVLADSLKHNESVSLRQYIAKAESQFKKSGNTQRMQIHRLECFDAYSYPLSVKRYLAFAMLHKLFSCNFLRQSVDYWNENNPDETLFPENVIKHWVELLGEDKDWATGDQSSWVMFRFFKDSRRLQLILETGAGPLTTFGIIDLLGNQKFVEQQTQLFIHDLNFCLQHSLNNGVFEQRQRHNLNIVIWMHEFILNSMSVMKSDALALLSHSNETVKNEAIVLVELSDRITRHVRLSLAHFNGWQDNLGDNQSFSGLTRNINDKLRELESEFRQDLSASSPVFGTDISLLETIVNEQTETVIDVVNEQIYWKLNENSKEWSLGLNTVENFEKNLDDFTVQHVAEISSLLVELVVHALEEQKINPFELGEQSSGIKIPFDTMQSSGTRTSQNTVFLNYLHPQPQSDVSVAQEVIGTAEEKYLKGGVLLESNMTPEAIWPYVPAICELPFVMWQEHQAYKFYGYHCRVNDLEPQRIPTELIAKLSIINDLAEFREKMKELEPND